jgi:hypothetical protein
MTITLIADEIYRELGSPSSLSVPSVAFWLRGHIGDVYNLLSTSYAISLTDGSTVEPEINEEEKAIFKKLFNVYYYDLKIRENLGAASHDILEVVSDGASVRIVNKNEISKTYVALRKEESNELSNLVNKYNQNAASPLQVVGDDTSSDDSTSTSYYETIRE